MLVRLREWWNRPDPMTAIILWQIDQTMEWINKWHDTRNWSRLWKRAAKEERMWRIKFRAQAFETVEELERWVEIADKRLELLKRFEWVADELNDYYCPICYQDRDQGHTDDCELAEAIDAA